MIALQKKPLCKMNRLEKGPTLRTIKVTVSMYESSYSICLVTCKGCHYLFELREEFGAPTVFWQSPVSQSHLHSTACTSPCIEGAWGASWDVAEAPTVVLILIVAHEIMPWGSSLHLIIT